MHTHIYNSWNQRAAPHSRLGTPALELTSPLPVGDDSPVARRQYIDVNHLDA